MSTPDCTPVDQGVKRCTKCGEVRSIVGFFAKGKIWKDGLHPWCRLCRGASAKRRRHQTKAALPEAMKAAAPRLFRRAIKRPDTDCWEMDGAKDKKGYARMNVAGHNVPAFHVSFVATHGNVPRQVIMHTCDNPGCFNPDHLVAGTYHENNADMWARGRGGGHRKLTDDQVREIRCLAAEKKLSQRRIAKIHGVTQAVVSNIHLGKSYRWVR